MRSCQHCGLPANDEAMLCTRCGNALPPPLPDTDTPPTLAPPTLVHPTYMQPTQQMPNVPVVISIPPAQQQPSGRRGSGVVIGMLLGFAVIAALVVIGIKVLENRSDSDASTETVTLAPPAETTTAIETSTAPAVSLAPTIAATTTTSAVPEATVAPTVAPLPTAPPVAGPGVSQVLRDPMSNGVPFTEVSASFALAQQLADALAADDWNLARQLEPAKSGFTDAQFAGYVGLDRASLILVDARPQGDGYRNLVVSVANEKDGARTTIFCLEWSASAVSGFVVQHTGVVGKLITLDGLVSSEAVLNDPSLLDLVMRKCVWS